MSRHFQEKSENWSYQFREQLRLRWFCHQEQRGLMSSNREIRNLNSRLEKLRRGHFGGTLS